MCDFSSYPQLQNFAKICKVLKLLKIKFDERQVARYVISRLTPMSPSSADTLCHALFHHRSIMTEQYGCAASLVVKVRDFVQEAAKDRPAHDAPIKSLISVRPKPWTRKVPTLPRRDKHIIVLMGSKGEASSRSHTCMDPSRDMLLHTPASLAELTATLILAITPCIPR